LVTLLQDTPASEAVLEQALDPIFDLDDYLDRLIWISFTQNADATRSNYYLYNTGPATGEGDHWFVLAWDSDISFSNHWRIDEPVYDVSWAHLLGGGENWF